jgi:outer membrane lipoprotein SlyB
MMAGPNPNTPQAQLQAGYGVVQAIDQLQRQDIRASAMGATGAAAAGGAMGAPTDKVYRVTLRMDDGSSQMLVEESMPGYKIGDRVRYSNGAVRPY